MGIRIEAARIHRLELRTRMPFKYGIATMTRAPHVFVCVELDVDGRLSSGIAADHLPPKWFRKDPNQPLDAEIAEMASVIDHAVNAAAALQAATPFALWRQLYEAQAAWGRTSDVPPLLAHFGTSLVERAVLDAFCRRHGKPFARLLRENRFGIDLGAIHVPLAGAAPADFLPARPLDRLTARHTVGLADPIRDADIAADERLDDGLPQSLEASIRTYRLQHFKIKLSGAADKDRDRLARIAALLEESLPAGYAFTLDGNEQFRSPAELQDYWSALRSARELAPFLGRLLFLEQPFHRDIALATSLRHSRLELPPLIIDESDAECGSLPRALELGYAGTSHKNCKGVFRSIANACLLARRRREEPALPAILSGEDLANIGPVALLQDLAVCATLGIESVERNGHHYFAGLSMFPAEVQQDILTFHGDLYHPSRDGWPTLTIEHGTVRLESINAAPFGVTPLWNVASFAE